MVLLDKSKRLKSLVLLTFFEVITRYGSQFLLLWSKRSILAIVCDLMILVVQGYGHDWENWLFLELQKPGTLHGSRMEFDNLSFGYKECIRDLLKSPSHCF